KTGSVSISGLSLAKSSNQPSVSAAGQPITYTYALTNTGNATLTGPFTVTDNRIGSFQCGTATTLAPGKTVSCTAPYTISLRDMNTGSVTNLATATAATTVNGQPVTSNQVSATVIAVQRPALALTKTASPTTYSKAGAIISY